MKRFAKRSIAWLLMAGLLLIAGVPAISEEDLISNPPVETEGEAQPPAPATDLIVPVTGDVTPPAMPPVQDLIVPSVSNDPAPTEEKKDPAPVVDLIKPEQPKPEEAGKGATFTITFDVQGTLNTQTVNEGATATRPQADPVLEGHTFVHWYNASGNAEVAFDFATPIAADLTLKAHFTPVEVPDAPQDLIVPVEIEEEDKETENADIVDLLTPVEEGELVLEGGLEEEEEEEKTEQEQTTEDDKQVLISTNVGDTVVEGDLITMTATLIGFEGIPFSLSWECSTDQGLTWESTGCTDFTQTFIASEETMKYFWQVAVVY